MTCDLPTGKREGLHLEFKAAEVLREPHKVAREVVGMLNAEGGEIWVGVPEDDGVALPATPIHDAHKAREQLHSRLQDLIEPSPLHDEVDVELVPAGSHGEVLVVNVCKPSDGTRRPFAWMRKGMYGFDRRDDHRVVRMSREEIRTGFSGTREADFSRARSIAWLRGERDREVGRAGQRRAFAGLVVAGSNQELDSQPDLNDDIRSWWNDMVAPPGGRIATSPHWSILKGQPKTPKKESRLQATVESDFEEDTMNIVAYPAGALIAALPTTSLTWADQKEKDESRRQQFHPYDIIGLCTSFCELGGQWLDRLDVKDVDILIEIAVSGVADFPLRAYSPRSTEWLYWRDSVELHECAEDPLVFERPLKTNAPRLIESPDVVAIQLIERLYEAFDFAPDKIPYEVDRAGGVVRLPT